MAMMTMQLPEERRRLDLIDGTLRADAPALAAKFDTFTRLARGAGKPPDEQQFRDDGDWRYDALVRRRIRRWCYTTVALLLTGLILILILELA